MANATFSVPIRPLLEPNHPATIDDRKRFGGETMGKILIGMAAAALWFVLSQAANAERLCQEVCDNGICVSRCVDNPDSNTIVRERDRGPGGELQAPSLQAPSRY
jgi:hypothetical protein